MLVYEPTLMVSPPGEGDLPSAKKSDEAAVVHAQRLTPQVAHLCYLAERKIATQRRKLIGSETSVTLQLRQL
jgi:hypothetical protein